jgi:Flp pilus assembly protein TadG
MGIRTWLDLFTDRRRSSRLQPGALVAHYWSGAVSQPREVRDIGISGAYIIAPDKFYPATLLQIIFEDPSKADSSICICGRVCRKTEDGFCVSFLFGDLRQRARFRQFLGGLTIRIPEVLPFGQKEIEPSEGVTAIEGNPGLREEKRLAAGMAGGPGSPPGEELKAGGQEDRMAETGEMTEGKRQPGRRKRPAGKMSRSSSGQALIEFALVLPLLFLLIVNVVNFGGMLYAWISVSNAARLGAQYYITGSATIGAPTRPAVGTIQTLVLNDLSALPNSATAQVCVSTSQSGTVSCNSGTAPAGAPPAAETAEGSPAITFAVAAIDVTYTYTPFIPLWEFPALKIHATLPPTAIHRQAIMRILQ